VSPVGSRPASQLSFLGRLFFCLANGLVAGASAPPMVCLCHLSREERAP